MIGDMSSRSPGARLFKSKGADKSTTPDPTTGTHSSTLTDPRLDQVHERPPVSPRRGDRGPVGGGAVRFEGLDVGDLSPLDQFVVLEDTEAGD